MLQQLDRELNATLDVQKVLDVTLAWTMRLFETDAGCVVLADGAEAASFWAQRGYDPGIDLGIDNRDRLYSQSLTGRVLRTGRGYFTGDVRQEPVYLAASSSTRSQLTVPLIHEQKILGAVTVESSLTDRFQEADLIQAERIVGHASVAIANALLYTQLQQANQDRVEFVSMISHELKTPMTAIQGFADLMLQGIVGDVNERQGQFLVEIRDNTKFMNRLITDLADVSRIESGQMQVALASVSMVGVAGKAMKIVQPAYSKKRIDLHCDIRLTCHWYLEIGRDWCKC